MKTEHREFFRNILKQQIVDLVSGQVKTITQMTTGDERIADIIDQTSIDLERNFNIRIRDRERRLIAKMQEALHRIDEGTYGICDDCGEDISEKRLIARPVTTLCIKCKTKQEKAELKGKWGSPSLRFSFTSADGVS